MSIPLLRPQHVAIFTSDPTGNAGIVSAKIQAFLLTSAAVGFVPGRVRPDLLNAATVTRSFSVSRNPVERVVADNFIREPETLQIQGTLSSTPLAKFGGVPFGSLFRFDLMQLAQLRIMQGSGLPLVVVLPARPYPSMALTTLVEDHSMRGKVGLSMTFQELEIVSPLSVPIDPDLLAAGAFIEADVGTQATETVPDAGGLL
jgi:hypothetical protein